MTDNYIPEKVREHERNFAVVNCDYHKACYKVHHDWVIKVYIRIGYPEIISKMIGIMMRKWRNGLQVSRNGKKTADESP